VRALKKQRLREGKKMTEAEVRKILRDAYGAHHHRISSEGEIEYWRIRLGWRIFGYLGDPKTIARLNTLRK
jgi:hypothetical protein